jgi:hypothetical protein
MNPSVVFVYVFEGFLVKGYEVCQPVDKVDVVLWEHDIVEILVILGDIEAQTEFLPLVVVKSPLEKK